MNRFIKGDVALKLPCDLKAWVIVWWRPIPFVSLMSLWMSWILSNSVSKALNPLLPAGRRSPRGFIEDLYL
ncbi:hypothetical protein EDE11_12334 [Methylomonas methanica]|uniref:Uncharacterized protein n=1 Tax=Methylomonas methanica TaxID=421 RepID=A0ABY2CHU5_METMH|nr:hypothetical protein EDE11_12334 [Methylomonas methanica]